MSSSVASSVRVDQPLTGFADCHRGILLQLQAFSGLPQLHEAAMRSQQVAIATLAMFDHAVSEHHADEERELFPAVLRSAQPGAEAERVRSMVERLTAEHRSIEALWKRLLPAVKAAARSKAAQFDGEAVEILVQGYLAHARYEEAEFLPLAQQILARNGNHMAALGLSLHMRHAPPVLAHI